MKFRVINQDAVVVPDMRVCRSRAPPRTLPAVRYQMTNNRHDTANNVNQLHNMLYLSQTGLRAASPSPMRQMKQQAPVPHLLNNGNLITGDELHPMGPRLPPLGQPSLGQRRMSIDRARDIQRMASSNGVRHLSVKYENEAQGDVEDDYDATLPIIGRKTSIGTSDHFSLASVDQFNVSRRNSGVFSRNSTFERRNSFRSNALEVPLLKHAPEKLAQKIDFRCSRKDSVGNIAEMLSNEFKLAMEDQLGGSGNRNLPSRLGTQLLESKPEVKRYSDPFTKRMPRVPNKTLNTGYKVRHEYGKNMERNWLKNQCMKKQLVDPTINTGNLDIHLDMFYSSEADTDDNTDTTNESNKPSEDSQTSMRCGGYSQSRRPSIPTSDMSMNNNHYKGNSRRRSLVESRSSSPSDIEIVFKDNQLMQRRTKHKMKKKRQRQLKRYDKFSASQRTTLCELEEQPIALSDQEIRALRLNLRSKVKSPQLTGKRRFLQIANVVYIAVQFKNILRNIRRKRRRILIKKRQQRIARMVVKELSEKKHVEETFVVPQRKCSHPPSLKKQFMKEVGEKLLIDVRRLSMDCDRTEHAENESDVSSEPRNVDDAECEVYRHDAKPSRFAAELENVSIEDVNGVSAPFMQRPNQRRRRRSVPKISRPSVFLIEVPCKEKQPKKRRGSAASVLSVTNIRPVKEIAPKLPTAATCRCHRHTMQAKALLEQEQARVQHQPWNNSTTKPRRHERKKRNSRIITVQTTGLMRTNSLENLAKKRQIELGDVLKDVCIPAKEVRLQILARKFRRQRRKREQPQQVRLSPVLLPERPPRLLELEVESKLSESELEDETNDSLCLNSDTDESFEFYGAPFVGTGVMWNTNSHVERNQWTEADVDREVKRITRLFLEMKECTYLRLDDFNTAVINRLNTM